MTTTEWNNELDRRELRTAADPSGHMMSSHRGPRGSTLSMLTKTGWSIKSHWGKLCYHGVFRYLFYVPSHCFLGAVIFKWCVTVHWMTDAVIICNDSRAAANDCFHYWLICCLSSSLIILVCRSQVICVEVWEISITLSQTLKWPHLFNCFHLNWEFVYFQWCTPGSIFPRF